MISAPAGKVSAEHAHHTAYQPGAGAPTQRVVKVRRDYNAWVASETMEDYALRYTPQRFRRWSEWRVANTAFGAASFLILEAVGATLLVQYGFVNAAWAIVVTGLVIFLAGLPLSVYAARYGVDMDLLTRGAGFGYIGSTITSLIYASFTFIFFALEAAVMAYALELAMGIPRAWGYLLCALVVVPLVTHGVSTISRFQLWTQPLWLCLLVLPIVYVVGAEPAALQGIAHYAGEHGGVASFELHSFGAALTVGIALITQMGEQADYLRFMPRQEASKRWRWWLAVLVGGPGWVVLGVCKMLVGAFLAYLAILHSVPAAEAVDPSQLYFGAYQYLFHSHRLAVIALGVFVLISQLKINVTNAYAGSLAWSNFFSRLTHSHPGRVVWVVFNSVIAFMLMEMDLFQALGEVLGLYSNIAIAWIMAVVADLVINKPLGWSPPGIEFKRAHLYDINPVGVGAMTLASALSMLAYVGVFGAMAQAFSVVIALLTALVSAPALAWLTRGKYYIARKPEPLRSDAATQVSQRCVICERTYESPDMAHCPAYQGPICSLCCTLDARCADACKPHANLAAQWNAVLRTLLPRRSWPVLEAGLGHFVLLMTAMFPLLLMVFWFVYRPQLSALAQDGSAASLWRAVLLSGLLKSFWIMLALSGVLAWWLVLTHASRRVAQEESNRQTQLLMREIDLHRATDEALQEARQVAEAARRQAEQANRAKSRYISAVSHELRTPLNSILGYAQLMNEDNSIPPHRRQAVSVIRRGCEHLLSLIEGTLDIAHIESGKLTLSSRPVWLEDIFTDLAAMFELQAAEKGLSFTYEVRGTLPHWVRADDKRVRQIFINVLGNAIKFTRSGGVVLRVAYAREMVDVEIQDSGPGMDAQELARVFEPFARGAAAANAGVRGSGGSGLGLTIAKMLTDLMGGEITVQSSPGNGSCFRIRLFLPELRGHTDISAMEMLQRRQALQRNGYAGPRRKILVVDNEEADRGLMKDQLQPLGFELREASNGFDCLDLLAAGLAPDAVLLDLAMPGMDGWETLRRIRQGRMPQPKVAIVSANAFDRALDHGLGVSQDDFLVKPLRRADLLEWLERNLQLQWLESPVEKGPMAPPTLALQRPHPPRDALQALFDLAQLGYFRGLMNQLAALAQSMPQCSAFLRAVEADARAFEFEKLCEQLGQILNGQEQHGTD